MGNHIPLVKIELEIIAFKNEDALTFRASFINLLQMEEDFCEILGKKSIIFCL
jgi:hypothetical protein